MNNKKGNLFIILLSILLFILTIFALILNENASNTNQEQLNQITHFSKIKNRNEDIVSKLSNTPNTAIALSLAQSLDPTDMERYCDIVFTQNSVEKLIY